MLLANFTPVKMIVSGLFFLQTLTGAKYLNLSDVFFIEGLAPNLRLLCIKDRERENFSFQRFHFVYFFELNYEMAGLDQ